MNRLTVVLSFIVFVLLLIQLEEPKINYDSSNYNSDYYGELNDECNCD